MNVAYNCDCMEYMKTLPDKYFDLAVVDPPYGDAGNGDGGAKPLRTVRTVSNGTGSVKGSTGTNALFRFALAR